MGEQQFGQVCRDVETEHELTLVSDVMEVLELIVNQYGNVIPKTDVDAAHSIIERLQIHDKDSGRHVNMLERRLNNLQLRLKEAEDLGQMDRPDIPWVKQEVKAIRWALSRS